LVTGEIFGGFAQKMNLGSIAAAPDAIEQMKAHGQALMPGKAGIH